MKQFLIISLLVFYFHSAWAIRTVGNGGGESELKVQAQYQALWIKLYFTEAQLEGR